MAKSKTSGQGRPRGALNLATKAVRQIAADFGEAAVRTLAQIAGDQAQPPAARVSACRELLDRGFGKPSAVIGIAVPQGSLADQGQSIIAAATTGALPLDHLSALMGALSAQAKLHETTELLQRLETIEALLAEKEPEKC